MSQTTPTNDPVYKRLYTFREMVADLLRSLFPADLLAAVDLRSLHRLPAEYVGDDFRQRRGDAVWRARVRGPGAGWLHVLVLLEFQSTGDREMALRVLEYTAMLYRELLRAREGTGRSGPLPAVLPVVLYNGESRWSAARDVSGLVEAVGPGLAPYQPRRRGAGRVGAGRGGGAGAGAVPAAAALRGACGGSPTFKTATGHAAMWPTLAACAGVFIPKDLCGRLWL